MNAQLERVLESTIGFHEECYIHQLIKKIKVNS